MILTDTTEEGLLTFPSAFFRANLGFIGPILDPKSLAVRNRECSQLAGHLHSWGLVPAAEGCICTAKITYFGTKIEEDHIRALVEEMILGRLDP